MSIERTATVTELVGKPSHNPDVVIIHAETDHGHQATLYYPADDLPEEGDEIDVWFEMGGWCTDDSPIYKNRTKP